MRHFFYSVIILVIGCTTSFAQLADNKIVIGTKHQIHSDILGEEREYWVSLPESYHPQAKYPIVYVLDGRFQFHSVASILRYLPKSAEIPEMIVVGILNTDRVRDLTPTNNLINSYGVEFARDKTSGGADNFLNFIRTELSPRIEAEYSTADYRMLIGHSHGGLFSLYSFIQASDFFNSFISVDPSLYWDKEIVKERLIENLKQNPDVKSRIYISSANNEGDDFLSEEAMVAAQNSFVDVLSSPEFRNLEVLKERFDDENHFTVPWISYSRGLLFVFDGFYIPGDKVRENPSLVIDHAQKVSEKFGYEILPHEGIVNFIGYDQLQKGNLVESIKYFRMNTKNYPYSANTYDSLGDAYKAHNDRKKAIESYQKSLELDPNSQSSKRKLEELMQN